MYIKIKDRNPSIKRTRQMKAQVKAIQNKKQKQKINKKSVKTLCK